MNEVKRAPAEPCPWCGTVGALSIKLGEYTPPTHPRPHMFLAKHATRQKPMLWCAAKSCGFKMFGSWDTDDSVYFGQAPERPIPAYTDEWLETATLTIRKRMLRVWHKDSCIPAVRIGIRVLGYFGIPSLPEPVGLALYTPEWFESMRDHPDMPLDQRPGHSWGIAATGDLIARAERPARPGASDSRGWSGHLLIRIDEPRLRLIDLSCDQLDRPERGYRFNEPLVLQIPERSMWTGDSVLSFVDSQGLHVVYQRAPHLTMWDRSGAWIQDSPAVDAMVAECIDAIPAIDAVQGKGERK